MNTLPSRNRGFSLIELLVVMAIIGIIAAYVVPAAPTILRGSQMTQASQILTDQISLARSAALAKNHQIEVRFIRFVDPESPGDVGPDGNNGNYHAIWCFEILDSGVAVPLDKPQMFPMTVVLSTSSSFSPILTNQTSYTQPLQPTSSDPQTYPRTSASYPNGVPYTYIPFRFNPDGSTTLLTQSGANSAAANDAGTNNLWFVTLQNATDRPTSSVPPANFFTLLIDPVGGTVKTYRPSI